ncbi:MAG: adenylate cyclase [Actinomycetota bacterium]|jgi:class 3 adenylate cyclase|nr:adenylate cyclase [Actinomycetota bacterium]
MRVRRSFAFVDLCGFTGFTDRGGDEDAVRLLSQFRSVVRDVASDRGVRIAKWLGDGAMLVSVESTPLIEAILAIDLSLRSSAVSLPLRSGMTAGDVIVFEGDDHVGSAVNLASRLCDVASAHEILATADVVWARPDGVTAEAAGPLPIAGFARPVHVFRLRPAQAQVA